MAKVSGNSPRSCISNVPQSDFCTDLVLYEGFLRKIWGLIPKQVGILYDTQEMEPQFTETAMYYAPTARPGASFMYRTAPERLGHSRYPEGPSILPYHIGVRSQKPEHIWFCTLDPLGYKGAASLANSALSYTGLFRIACPKFMPG